MSWWSQSIVLSLASASEARRFKGDLIVLLGWGEIILQLVEDDNDTGFIPLISSCCHGYWGFEVDGLIHGVGGTTWDNLLSLSGDKSWYVVARPSEDIIIVTSLLSSSNGGVITTGISSSLEVLMCCVKVVWFVFFLFFKSLFAGWFLRCLFLTLVTFSRSHDDWDNLPAVLSSTDSTVISLVLIEELCSGVTALSDSFNNEGEAILSLSSNVSSISCSFW